MEYISSGSRGGAEGAMAPPQALYKQVIKKMAAKGGHIDFMFLAPPPTRPLDPMLYMDIFSQFYLSVSSAA